MKTKKTLGLFAVALTALACALPGTAKAAGDIRSIEFYPEPEGGEVGVVRDLSRPLVAGDKVKFKIRLANRDWAKTDADNSFLNPWMLRSLAGAGAVSNRLPQVGLRVSGGLRYADIVSWNMPEGDIHHTDLICQYTVQAGDFALPLKLSNGRGTAPAMEADPTEPTETPDKSNYFLSNNNLWGFFPQTPADNVTSNRLEFYFGPERLNPAEYPGADTFRATEVRDYDLSGANIQIKAIDFDDTYADEANKVWRNVAAGTTTTTPAVPRLSIPGGASGTYKYYVWTKDSSVAEVEGGETKTFFDGSTHVVGTVTVTAGEMVTPFTIRAKAGKVGESTEVYMADTPTNIYSRAGALITNFTMRVIKVIEPPPPSISLVLDNTVVTASTNNYISVASLDVELSEPWNQDVDVLLTPSMTSGANPFIYIGMSTAMSGPEYYDGEVIKLTVKAGNTKASDGGTMLYVYANRANDDTAKGIRFTPSIDSASGNASQATAFFTGEFTPTTLQINPLKPVITSPANGHQYLNIPANTQTDFTIKVADAMWQLHGKDPTNGQYTVFIDYNGSGTYEAITNLTANASGEITFQYRYIVGGRDYQSNIYVENQDGYSSKDTPLYFSVRVNKAKTVEVTADNPKKTYCEGGTAELTFTFSEEFDYPSNAYLFLEPADVASSNLVECDAFTIGMPVLTSSLGPADPARLTFKDGWKDCVFKYNVVVRSTNETDADNVIAVWGSSLITLVVTNTPPSVTSVEMNNRECTENGGTLEVSAAVGVQNKFVFGAVDAGELDLASTNFVTVVTFEDGNSTTVTNLYGNPSISNEVFYTFRNGGDGVKNKIKVYSYDKDMTATEIAAAKKNPFTVFVETTSAPAISLSPYNSSTYFTENDTGDTKGRIYVDLTVPPTDDITVALEVKRVGTETENYTLPVLNTTTLDFASGQTRNSFFLMELDGTTLGGAKGFYITAQVTNTTDAAGSGKTWAEYYKKSENFVIFVSNVAPVIGPEGAVSTNEIPIAINVPYPIPWSVTDVEADMKNMTVTWSGSTATNMNLELGKEYSKDILLTTPGSHTVTLTVRDKDGASVSRPYYFKVAASKLVELHPRQLDRKNGRSDGISKYSKKFTSALGIGEGRVWAEGSDGVNAPTDIKDFVHTWTYKPQASKATVYARGYKYVNGVAQVDDGSLTPGMDFAIDAKGSLSTSAPFYEYWDADKKDSFFYCWILNTSGGDSGYEGSHLNGVVQPEIGMSSLGRQEVGLPEYDDAEDASYETTLLEAIFSLEYLRSDNVGDINQDGIPDIYAAGTEWSNGTFYEASGASLDDDSPGDLKRLDSWNEDVVDTKSGAEAGDFLPSASSSGNFLIPTLLNWATAGASFTAYMELRGTDENLNYRTGNDGLNRNVRGTWVSDPNFSKAEWVALAYYNSALGCPKLDPASTNWVDDVNAVSNWVLTAESAWIPENRTDPTVDDTDGDGYPDGYEYYFWYKAAVGEINEKGEWIRLKGSKFSLDDIATGVELTSDAIARAFNPTVSAGSSMLLLDTDNDGLTDLEEYTMGTNPIHWDSDLDGLSDLWEIMYGMNPLVSGKDSKGVDQGGTMNLDGDFMARWDSEPGYAIATFKLADGSVREYALTGNPNKYFTITDAKTGAATLTEDAMTNQFAAISVFRYGAATDNVFVPRFRGGMVVNTVDYFGSEAEAKPLDALVWELGEATNADITVKLDQKVTLVHDQVNAQFGFDPRTGWSNKEGFVADRWNGTKRNQGAGQATDAQFAEGEAGKAVNTVAYTARDEYLLLKYRYETNKESPSKLKNFKTGKDYTAKNDEELWSALNENGVRRCPEVFVNGTTAPNLPFENPDWVSAVTTMGDVAFASELHGADTDEDGVPDGWELYVGHNPNSNAGDDTKDSDADDLDLAAEYAGTDSCNAYTNCLTIIEKHPGVKSGWYNKFFPTNPAELDTDGDGLSDSQEGSVWMASFVWGNGAAGSDEETLSVLHEYSFIYGTPIDDGSVCIRGGGLNPCTVDTDGDCLPDPWERQFAGVVFTASGSPSGSLDLDEGVIDVIRRGDALVQGSSATNVYITAGMDGTFGKDAWSDPTYRDPATGTIRDFDFDHDGLQNYQEYLVQALRHLRYDDSSTPLMGQWMPSGSPASLKYFGFLPMNIMDGETFYAKVKKAGYPATGAWNFRELGYFAPPPHAWDKMAHNLLPTLKGKLNYDEMGYRVMLPPKAVKDIAAIGYCSTDPRNWDSDGDGMDDYYELFHGLNPLLGDVTGGRIDQDLVAQAYGNRIASWYNAWTGWPMTPPEDPTYDAMRFPWLMGTPGCDADGDGLSNYDEALFANMTSPQPTHTDPTPLWMTDASALNNASFVAQYYKMDCDALAPDLALYPWTATDPDGFMFAFEENEGYDTDHDGINDSEEKKMTVTAISDPLNFADPSRRQALWFSGTNSAAVSCAYPPANQSNVAFDSFRQFTVEAWINPEVVDRDQVVLERAVVYTANTLSNNVSRMRANFRVGIRADGRLYGLFDSSNAVESDTPESTATVTGQKLSTNVWVHVALSFNGSKLALFMDGDKVGEIQTTLPPANGIVGVTQQPLPGGETFPAGSGYTFYTRSAVVLGASARDADAVVLSKDTTWESYGSFYMGFIDEVRVWDGAKSETALKEGLKTRLSVSDALSLRQDVYNAWTKGATRNDNDANGTLPVELVFHYNFSTLPGALDPFEVMWEPTGFTKNVLDNVRVGGQEVPGDLYCGWWKSLPVHSTVYMNYRWVPWIPNTVSHLPAMDGSTVDSKYWGERVAGMVAASEVSVEAFVFPNTMNPYSYYHNVGGNDATYYNNRLALLTDVFSNRFDEVASLYRFEKRTTSLGTTDLLPLGGAFAKRTPEMWDGQGASDAWAYTVDDLDSNGLPDWWEALWGLTSGDTLETLVDYKGDGSWMIPAREAYLRDLAAGMLPNASTTTDVNAAFKATSDSDNDGLPDWWETLYGIAAESGEDDHDGDGLSNFAEYLIAECFSNYGFQRVKPDQIRTFAADGQLVPDFFLTQGKLYLGEMFADHDFMEDAWEDRYATRVGADTEALFASRYVNDMWADYDADGWSNFAECRAGTDPQRVRTVSYVSDTMVEYPLPTVRAVLRYNGAQKAEGGNVVVRSFSGSSVKGRPDAVWSLKVGATSASSGSSSDSTGAGNTASQVGNKYERHLGVSPGGTYTVNMGSGLIVPGTLKISFRDVSAVYRSDTGQKGPMDAATTAWRSLLRDSIVDKTMAKGDIVTTDTLEVVGEVNYETGDLTINLDKLGRYVYVVGSFGYSVEPTGYYEKGIYYYWAYERLDLSKSFMKAEWNGQVVASDSVWNVNLSMPVEGHVKEGVNTFEAFLDLNADGLWTPGEPYGVATGVEVGWSATGFTAELTDVAPQMFRIDLMSAAQANEFEAQKSLNDRGVQSSSGIGSNVSIVETAIGQNMPAATDTKTRVRVVRSAISAIAAYGSKVADAVVLDVTRDLTANPIFSERDLLDAGELDLDWGKLGVAAQNVNVAFMNITSVVYRVILGDGTWSPTDPTNNNNLATAFVNVYEPGNASAQALCVPVAPKGTIYSAQPTFKWTQANSIGKDYPAFQLRVWKGATVVYDSGVRRAPARDIDGVYSWTAPIYADMTTPNGVVFSNTNNYTWSVSMLDAKFTTPNTNETKAEFRVEATGLLGSIADYGTLTAKVYYFGPVPKADSATAVKDMIRVQAFTTPDFTGMPAGEARVSDLAALVSTGSVVTMRGLPVGQYYVRAFIDTQADAKLANWESWGYACYVGDGDAQAYKFTPKAFTVAKGASVPAAEVFIEDMDIDNDGLPDAWEYSQNGSLDKQSSPSGNTFFTKVNTNLTATVSAYVNLSGGASLMGAGGGSVYASMTLMNALLSEDSTSIATMASLLSATDEPAVSEKLVVKIDSFSLTEGATVSVKTEVTGTGNELVIAADEATVGVYLVASDTVDFAAAKSVKVKSLVIKANATTSATVEPSEIEAALKANNLSSSAFFKVKLVQE